MAIILPLVERFMPTRERTRDWTNDEVAELYRVERALHQANIAVETDRGVTDEGDPWFVFCRHDGEVLAHIARYGGRYHLFSAALPTSLEGPSLSALTRAFASAAPPARESTAESRVVLHPSALLSLLVLSIFFFGDNLPGHHGQAKAEPSDGGKASANPGGAPALRAVLANMLSMMNVSDAEEVARSAFLAGQAVIGFIGAGLADDGPTAALAGAGSPGSPAYIADVAPAPAAAASLEPADESAPLVSNATQTTATAAQCSVGAPARDRADGLTSLPTNIGIAEIHTSALLASGVTTLAGATTGIAAALRRAATESSSRMVVTVSSQGDQVNLPAATAVREIHLVGAGAVTLSGLDGEQTIDVNGGSAVTLSLVYASNESAVSQTLKITDGSSVTLAAISDKVAIPQPIAESTNARVVVDLTVDSGGTHSNLLTVPEAATQSTNLNLNIVGTQDLVLNENASALEYSTLNATGLRGSLTLGVDLSGSPKATVLLGSSDFIVNNNDSVALLHVPDNAAIQFGTNLASASIMFDNAVSTHTLNLSLRNALSGQGGVSVGVAEVGGVADLNLASNGSDSNQIGAIVDASLQTLNIRGDDSLSIGSIEGVGPADAQDIAINAGALTGALKLDLNDVPDSFSGSRTIAIVGGQRETTIGGVAASENLIVQGGSGRTHLEVAAGAESVTFSGWRVGDTISVNGGRHADAVVNATHFSSAAQFSIDSQSLNSAGTMAANLSGISSPRQAVVFDHDGGLYVSIDANGDHGVDPGVGALIHIVGTINLSELQHAFFSD